MIEKTKEWSGVVALLAIILMLLFPSGGDNLGAGTRYPNGLSADSTSPTAGQVRGTTLTSTGAATLASAIVTGTMTQTGVATYTAQPVFDAGVLYSGTLATSSIGTATYTAANITGINSILHTAASALTATLPASSTLTSLVPTTGDRETIVLHSVGAGTITLAGGSGTTLTSASSTKAIPGGGSTILEFVRRADTDIAVYMSGGSF